MKSSLNDLFFSSETPSKPSLTVITTDPVDGDTLALNCSLLNNQVDNYQFFHKGKPIGLPQPNNILNLAVSTLSNQNGDYQCNVFIGNINSTQLSNKVDVKGRWNF